MSGGGPAWPGTGRPVGQEDPWATITRFDEIRRRLGARYVGRDRIIRLLQLAVICREHLLLIGPPGTAKTDLVVSFAAQLRTVPFRILLSKFTEPAELFGPLDVKEFHEGRYRIRSSGMLPEAELAVLDEVFQGSSAILNTLLALIGDRRFHNGEKTVPVPLLSLIGTTNSLPAGPGLEAFTDRFLLRARVTPVASEHFDELIRLGSQIEAERLAEAISSNIATTGTGQERAGARPSSGLTVADVNRISNHLGRVQTDAVDEPYRSLVRGMLHEHVVLSDRRIVQGLKLVRGAALLNRSTAARPADLWPLAHLWTQEADEGLVAEMVNHFVDQDGGDPSDRSVTPAQIVREAEFIVRRFDQTADHSPGAIDSVLIDLNQLRTQLVSSHPQAAAERDQIDAASRRVQEHHDRG